MPAYVWIYIDFIPQNDFLFQCEFKVFIRNYCCTIYFINNKSFINIDPYSTTTNNICQMYNGPEYLYWWYCAELML